MVQNIISSREGLQLAKLYNEMGTNTLHTYQPNGKQFQICNKYKEDTDREKGAKVLFDIAIIDGTSRTEYKGKDATTLAKVITGEARSVGTRAKKATSSAEKIEALKKEVDSLHARLAEIVGEVTEGKKDSAHVPTEAEWDAYRLRLEAEARSQAVAKALEDMTEEEILAELARRKAAKAE